MAVKGYKTPLEAKDLWSLNLQDSSQTVVPRFLEEWEKEQAKAQMYVYTHTHARTHAHTHVPPSASIDSHSFPRKGWRQVNNMGFNGREEESPPLSGCD